jgi:LexA-binding, inner membrane-associated putative hydrolase
VFVGHYGPSLAAKGARNSIPLWILFITVQLLDVLWSVFVLLGIEKVRIVPGITATNPLDLYYMPYTHSLLGAMLWSIAAGIAYYLYRKSEGWSAAAIVGAAVLSHWVLDWLVHRPDLPLYDNSFKVGLGLWNYPVFTFALEIAFLFGGMNLYRKTTKPVARGGRHRDFWLRHACSPSIYFLWASADF